VSGWSERKQTAARWVVWFLILGAVTAVLTHIRSERDQGYVPLPYLLVVLGASASVGRALGFVLAGLSFVLMDYFLQSPYGHMLTFARVGDIVTLLSFFTTAAAGSQLLYRARRERDAALRRADEVAALSLERERLMAEAKTAAAQREAEHLKDFLLASVSHDLRTPLTTIKAMAQEEQRTGVSRSADIEQNVDVLTAMVADLLDLSRLRSGTFSVTLELNSAEDAVGAAIRNCEGLLHGRKIHAVFADAKPAVYGTFDFMLTLRILSNLIENALRFSGVDEDVVVSIARQDEWIIFGVADRGPGVADEERQRVFDPFYRPVNSPPDRGRAGLGLAIARALAEAQQGSVWYEVREGGGSVFSLRLPAADVDESETDEPL
jgi:K+-sensing histidine kinase KdpD